MNANPTSGHNRRITLPGATQSGLDAYIATVKRRLLCGSPIEIVFPDGTTLHDWPDEEIQEMNTGTFDSLRGNGNLYAIFVGGGSGIWMPKYVGTSARKALRKRFRDHLIKKSEKTASVLFKVQDEVSNGGKIAIAYVLVEPGIIRRYAETRIISEEKDLTTGRLSWKSTSRR